MIKFLDVINRIKLKCPSFMQSPGPPIVSRVGASVAFQAALSGSADLPTPHCFVMPVDFKDFSLIEYDEAYPESLKVKVVKETFSTVICINNSMARGGKDGGTDSLIPIDQLSDIQAELEDAFLGWKPGGLPSYAGEINLAGGEYADSDNKLLWYTFEWSILYRRGNGGLTPAQQAEVDQIVYGNQNDPNTDSFLIDELKARNQLSDDTLQPVANIPLENNSFPVGPTNAEIEAQAYAHLDLEQHVAAGDGWPTGDDIEPLASKIFQAPIGDDKGITSEEATE